MYNSKKNIFIVGPARSGTTILQQIILTDEDYFSTPETHFFSEINPINRLLSKLPNNFFYFRGVNVLNKLFKIKISKFKSFFLTKKQIYNFFFLAFHNASRLNGKKNWCEKTPRHLFFIHELYQMGFNFRVLIIVRNPIDTLLSQSMIISKFKHKWGGYFNNLNDRILSLRLLKSYNEILKLNSLYNNIAIIDYDDLINNPNQVISKINKEYNIECRYKNFNPSNIFNLASEPWKKNNENNSIKKIKHNYSEKVVKDFSKFIKEYNLIKLYNEILSSSHNVYK